MKSNRTFFLLLIFVAKLNFIAAQNIIPLPNSIQNSDEKFTVTTSTSISGEAFAELSHYLGLHITEATGFRLNINPIKANGNSIILQKTPNLGIEEYKLVVKTDTILLEASTHAGMFYAIQTLLQLMPPEVYANSTRFKQLTTSHAHSITISGVTISDAPRMAYRGAMLDVSRTFFNKEQVMSYIDWLSRHKLNKFHWHLSDDEGWRIEIKSYPELTTKGAWRGVNEILPPWYGSGSGRYGGFFTQDDVREVVAYAAFRNVEVIPEIELPGHAQAITHCYPETFCRPELAKQSSTAWDRNVLCAGREENYAMIESILAEVAGLFPSQYIHIGGDEVSMKYWQNCPKCKEMMRKQNLKSTSELMDYFVRRTEKIVMSLGKNMAVWNDAVNGGALDSSTLVYCWKDINACQKAVMAGQKIVMMPAQYAYFDMKQGPNERGHNWAGMIDLYMAYSMDPAMVKVSTQQQANIQGVASAQFGEMFKQNGFMEYQAYPRICAMAEVGWTKQSLRNYDDFCKRLTVSHYERLGQMGIRFRLPEPEVTYVGDTLFATRATEGSMLYYSVDDFETCKEYTTGIATNNPWKYSFRSTYYGAQSPVVSLTNSLSVMLKPLDRKSFTLPAAQYTPSNGIWRVNIASRGQQSTVNRMDMGDSYVIIKSGQAANPLSFLRLYVDPTRQNINFTITNNGSTDDLVTISFAPSPYKEPKVSVKSSLEINARFPLINSADYNFASYTRSANGCANGDFITYTFDEPIRCRSIDIATGIPELTRFIVTNGEVMVSADGFAYQSFGMLDDDGLMTIKPTDVVKSIRINIKGGNGEPIIAFQDLKIK